jgi:hypothetical protein
MIARARQTTQGGRALRLHGRSEVNKIADRMSEILFAAEMEFRRLHGCMTRQKLNLLQFATAAVAQPGTGSWQVMRGKALQARSLAAGLNCVPHNILQNACGFLQDKSS